MIERFDLDPRKKGRAYSKGNRQKVALVAALASDVELLVLDEPTSGLDPLMEAVFQDTIRDITSEGRTVLLSSHILAQVEALCERVTIIRLGRTVESGTLSDLRHLTRTSIAVETVQPADGVAALPGVHDAVIDGTRARFDVDTAQLDEVVRYLSGLGIRTPDEHAADARGAVPASLRRRDRAAGGRRRGGIARRSGAVNSSTLTGTATLVRLILRRDRVRLSVWVLGITLLVLVTASSIERPLPDPGRPRHGRRDRRGQRRPDRPPGSGVRARHARRPGGVQLRRLRVRRRRADGHVPRRPPHPRRRGGRPDRAPAGDRRRPQRAGHRGATRRGRRLRRARRARRAEPRRPGPPRRGSVAFGLAIAGFGFLFACVTAVAAQTVEYTRPVYGLAVRRTRRVVHPAGDRRRRQRHAVVAVADGLGAGDATVRRRAVVAAAAPARGVGPPDLGRVRPPCTPRSRQRAPATRPRSGGGRPAAREPARARRPPPALDGRRVGGRHGAHRDLLRNGGDRRRRPHRRQLRARGPDRPGEWRPDRDVPRHDVAEHGADRRRLRRLVDPPAAQRGDRRSRRGRPRDGHLPAPLERSHLLSRSPAPYSCCSPPDWASASRTGSSSTTSARSPDSPAPRSPTPPRCGYSSRSPSWCSGSPLARVAVVWAVFGLFVVIGFLGELLQLPSWLMDLSPFQHVPAMPAEGFTSVPLVVLTIVAAAVVRRRDGRPSAVATPATDRTRFSRSPAPPAWPPWPAGGQPARSARGCGGRDRRARCRPRTARGSAAS